MANPYDLIIRNATVVDGSGDEPFAADVAVRDGKILEVGKVNARGFDKNCSPIEERGQDDIFSVIGTRRADLARLFRPPEARSG